MASEGSPPPKLEINRNFGMIPDNKYEVITNQWVLTASFPNEKEAFLNITAKYRIILSVSDKLPKEFWDLYLNTSMQLILFPYFREFVQNTTSRMNIPPLTLPILFK